MDREIRTILRNLGKALQRHADDPETDVETMAKVLRHIAAFIETPEEWPTALRVREFPKPLTAGNPA